MRSRANAANQGNSIKRLIASAIALSAATAYSAAAEPSIEVLHFWTTGGEAAALATVKEKVEADGVTWNDAPVAGGGGDNAKTVMKARINAGNPPTAMLMLGQEIVDWKEAGLLADLGTLASDDGWDEKLTDAAKAFTKIGDQWVGAPTNIHRVNMLWASKAAFEKIGATPPATWEEFNALAPRFREAGVVPLAHGGQAWQDMTLFDSVALGIGGTDYYRKAFVELDIETLGGDTTRAVFEQMRLLSGMLDENFAGRDWNLATAMVINGEAAMQIMGDWSKGEFTAAGKTANSDFLCVPAPGTTDKFTYLINSLSMFEAPDSESAAGQAVLARAIVDPEVQRQFSIAKGSIPAVKGVPTDGFDACALAAIDDLEAASAADNLVPTVAFTHAADASIVSAMTDVVTEHFNTEMPADEAVELLVEAVETAL